jgi:hypothetical protein
MSAVVFCVVTLCSLVPTYRLNSLKEEATFLRNFGTTNSTTQCYNPDDYNRPSNNRICIILIKLIDELMISLLLTPNVVVEWLIHLLRILEVPDSNLNPKTRYPEIFVVFLSPPGKCR